MSAKVIHFELPADDLERAQSFYREVFDWKIDPVPEINYTSVTTSATDENGMPSEPGAINGGMVKRDGQVPGPVLTIGVDDIDACLKKVESRGGAALSGREPVGDMGFAAYFKDPEGNIMGLWETAT